jgi:hypothetical protein
LRRGLEFSGGDSAGGPPVFYYFTQAFPGTAAPASPIQFLIESEKKYLLDFRHSPGLASL